MYAVKPKLGDFFALRHALSAHCQQAMLNLVSVLYLSFNEQLESDTTNCDPKRDSKCIPKLTQDEALCKYGQTGNARGEACKRVKEAGGSLPKSGGQVKSLGGAYAM